MSVAAAFAIVAVANSADLFALVRHDAPAPDKNLMELRHATAPACDSPGEGLDPSGVDWRIVAAEQESRSIVMVSGEPDAEAKILWRWNPAEDPSLTPEMAKTFGSIDECKPVDGGRTILVNASYGGVAAVDVDTCRARWYACLPNHGEGPHSLDLLPDGRIAVAHSTGVDALQLIDLNGHPFEPELQKVVVALPLRGAHGVVWDAVRKSLFAIGYTNLLELAYRPERMAVEVLHSWDYSGLCGDAFGHDLVPDGRGGYFFSNHTGVWDFSPETGKFAPVLLMANVKSFSRDAEKGDLLAVPRERWWTDRMLVRGRDAALRTVGPFAGARFYKARWMTACPFSPDLPRSSSGMWFQNESAAEK